MHANWISTAAALPSEGTIVEFVLDERECPMHGVYTLGRFESRWYFYSPTRVCRWRVIAPVAVEHELPSSIAIQQRHCFAGAVLAAVAASVRDTLRPRAAA